MQPADELKIETVADSSSYKPGGEARIKFRVTNSHGEGVHAALGLQVVDEAVFALAEKQPGFAKVFFYLEQEVMKPRYEIHSIGMPEIVEPAEESQSEQRDRAARALFSATEIVSANKFETEFGKDVPMTKYAEYSGRYQAQFQKEAFEVARKLTQAYKQNPKAEDPARIYARLGQSGEGEYRDAWGTTLTLEPVPWDAKQTYYRLRSAGPDRQFNTNDDMATYLLFHRQWMLSSEPGSTTISVDIEHGRGPLNGRGEIVGTVTDPTGAVVSDASVEVRAVASGKTRTARTDASGRFSLVGIAGWGLRGASVCAGVQDCVCDNSLCRCGTGLCSPRRCRSGRCRRRLKSPAQA